MKVSIDTHICEKNNLSVAQMLLMLFFSNEGDYERDLTSLIDKGFVTRGGNLMMEPTLSAGGVDVVNEIILDSQDEAPRNDSLETLAAEMQKVFPSGSKTPGKSWRCSQREIVNKLKKWKFLYGKYTDENGNVKYWTDSEIIQATRNYVGAFNGNYTYMRQLKYFILKFDTKLTDDGGVREEISDLASQLQIMRDGDDFVEDITITMR